MYDLHSSSSNLSMCVFFPLVLLPNLPLSRPLYLSTISLSLVLFTSPQSPSLVFFTSPQSPSLSSSLPLPSLHRYPSSHRCHRGEQDGLQLRQPGDQEAKLKLFIPPPFPLPPPVPPIPTSLRVHWSVNCKLPLSSHHLLFSLGFSLGLKLMDKIKISF